MNNGEQNENIIIEEEEEDIDRPEEISINNQNEVRLLRTEIHNKSEMLKKYQNENKNLRKKYGELLELMKKKDSKNKKQVNHHDDHLKWKNTWEKVITLMTEIIPYSIPKETSPDQQRKILYELTKRLCQIARNTNESIEYKNLKNKYTRNKEKLIKLKEQCNSLLDIIQSKKNQTLSIKERYYRQLYENDDDDVLYNNYYDSNNKQNGLKSKFYFQPVHDDIYMNHIHYERENSPTIQNLYYQEQKLNQKIYNNRTKSNRSKNNVEANDKQSFTKKQTSSKKQNTNTKENDTIYSSSNESKDKILNNDQETTEPISNAKEHIIDENKNIDESKSKAKKSQELPKATDLTFSNPVIIDAHSNSKTEESSKKLNSQTHNTQNKINKSSTKEIKEENNPQNFLSSQNSKETTSKAEYQKNEFLFNQKNSNALNEFNTIDQEFSEKEAEEVLNELESMKSSSDAKGEIIQTTIQQRIATASPEKNTNYNDKKKSGKKDFRSYQIRYGNSVNELIDITNKLRDQYYEVNKKYGHLEKSLEFSKENDIVRIQDPILDQ